MPILQTESSQVRPTQLEGVCTSWLPKYTSNEVSAPLQYIIKLVFLTTLDREHLYRNHSPPKYQCRRCSEDLKTAGALGTHSKQIPACDPCTSTQDQDLLDDVMLERLRSKKGMGQKKSESEKWTEVYKIVFPNDRVPSPCMSALPALLSIHHD